jgi:hypothetical protein
MTVMRLTEKEEGKGMLCKDQAETERKRDGRWKETSRGRTENRQ